MNIDRCMDLYPELCHMLGELPEEALSKLVTKKYRPGDYLIAKDQCDSNLFIILKGICDIVCTYETGVMVTTFKISEFDVIGFAELFDPSKKRFADIIARTEVLALIIPGKIFTDYYGKCQKFTVSISLRIINRFLVDSRLSAECKNYPIYLKVVTYLIHAYLFYRRQYPVKYEGLVKINENRQDIAEIIGIDIRTVNRVIEKIKNERYLVIIKGKIHIDKKNYIHLTNLKLAGQQ